MLFSLLLLLLSGYIDKDSDPLDDILSLLLCLYKSSSSSSSEKDFNLNKYGKLLPFCMIGHSMGGCISILIANILTNIKNNNNNDNLIQTKFSLQKIKELQEISQYFKGIMLLGPAIKLTISHYIVRFTLQYVLSPFFPYLSIPGDLNDKTNDKNIWNNDDYYDYVINDGYPNNPNGLSWGPKIRCRSASVLFDMSEKALLCSEHCTYPFIIIHDPLDSIVKIDGSRLFFLQAKTSPGNNLNLPSSSSLLLLLLLLYLVVML